MKCQQHLPVGVDARRRVPPLRQLVRRSEVKIAGAEKADQSDDDQVNGDDIVQQSRDDEYENSGDQRYQRTKTKGDVH